jgi:serine/threonine protein phosphatase 1
MGTIVIGDVHGNSAALADLLDQFVPELAKEDCTVFLGDYIDRGPDSKGCIDRILEFQKAAPGPVIALKGNHEDWLLRTYRDYTRHSWVLGMEAFDTIRSYSPVAEAHLRAELERAGQRLVFDKVRMKYSSIGCRLITFVSSKASGHTGARRRPSASTAESIPAAALRRTRR